MQNTSKGMTKVYMGLSEDRKYITFIVNPDIKLPEGVSELAFIVADIENSGIADIKELLTIEDKGNLRYALPADLNSKCKGLFEFMQRVTPLIFQKDQAKTPEEHKRIDEDFGNIVKEIRGREDSG